MTKAATTRRQEPIYIAQTGEEHTPADRREWLHARAEEGRAKGCTAFRASINERPFLLLIEGWESLPEDQGEPRFSFTAQRGRMNP